MTHQQKLKRDRRRRIADEGGVLGVVNPPPKVVKKLQRKGMAMAAAAFNRCPYREYLNPHPYSSKEFENRMNCLLGSWCSKTLAAIRFLADRPYFAMKSLDELRWIGIPKRIIDGFVSSGDYERMHDGLVWQSIHCMPTGRSKNSSKRDLFALGIVV